MTAGDDFPFYQYARLVRQAHLEGASLETLRLMIAEASAEGARRALEQCGLGDSAAVSDMGELRGLLDAWRDTKKTARRAITRWLITALLMTLSAALAVKARLLNL